MAWVPFRAPRTIVRDPRGPDSRVLSSALSRVGAFLVEPGLVYEYDRLHAVAEAELLEDVRDVGLYGRLADVELLTDLCVGQAAGDKQKDVLLSCGELV